MELDRRQFIAIGGAFAAAGLLPATAAEAHPDEERGPIRPGEPEGMWLPGDTHVHDDHSSDGSAPRQLSNQRDPGNLPVSDQIGYAESVGLAFLPLTDHRTFDQHWDPLWRSDRLLLLTGEEVNGSPHAIVLGAVDTVVDGANPPGSAAFRHVQQSIWDAHAQDAFWSVAHPDDGEYTPAGGPNDNASVQGVDGVELWNASSNPDVEIEYAENRWNHGFRFGAVAASDSHFKELRPVSAPGRPTTWVFAAERSVRAILDALRAGRTTLSFGADGPFATIEADVDGDGRFEAMGGDEVIVDGRLPKRAALRVRVRAAAGMRVLVYAAPGRSAGPVATLVPDRDDQTWVLPLTLAGDQSWYRVEVRAPGDLSGREADPNLPDQLRAATSPVFVSLKRPAAPAPEIALPAPTGADDRADLVLGERGGFAGFADVAVDGPVTHVVAEVHEDHRTSVVYRRIDGHGNEHADRGVDLSGRSGTARAPRVVASGTDVWVVWQDARGQEQPHRPGIWLRHSRNGGRSFAPAVRLGSGQGRAEHPALALLDGRHPVVAWTENSGGAFDVHVQVVGVDRAPVNVSADGKVVVPGTPADARSPIHPASLFPAVAVTGDRRILVTWQDNRFDPDAGWTGHTPPAGQPAAGGTNPDNWEILAALRPGPDQVWGAPVRVSANDDAADRHPSVTVDRDGAYVVAWETKTLSAAGVNLSLRASRSADGVTWSPAETLGLDPNAMSQRPRLAADPDGTVRAVWYDSRSADWRWKVFTARRTGSGWTPPVQVSTLGNATWPAVDKGAVVFTSDRRAERSQRDRTQEVYLLRRG